MVQQRGEGAEPPVGMLGSRLGGMIAVAETREHRLQNGRSRWVQAGEVGSA